MKKIAEPFCTRCGARMVWLGIGPAAEAICKRDCKDKCPKCLSKKIEPFVKYQYMSFYSPKEIQVTHCCDCGAVFD